MKEGIKGKGASSDLHFERRIQSVMAGKCGCRSLRQLIPLCLQSGSRERIRHWLALGESLLPGRLHLLMIL